MRLRKALSVVLATTLALTTPIQAFATDNVEIILPDKVNSSVQEPGAGKSDAILKSEAASFNVTLPTVLPITVTSDGTVITSDEVKLTNQSAGPVEIKSVEVVSQNNWNLVEFGTDFSNSKVGLSKYGLQLKGDNVPTSGLLGELSWGAIANSKELPLNYDANIAPQKNNLVDLVIANVVFTVGWYEATGSGEVEPPYEGEAPIEGEEYISGNYSYVYGSYYDENGAIVDNKLSGWSVKIIDKTKTSYVQPLEEIKGEPVVSYYALFYEYPNTTLTLEGTWTNRNVTTMNSMFYGSQAATINLSNFNTSNVTSMHSMFYGSQATTLDISNFNTSNVTDMNGMFYSSKATTLDLSSFNTSNVTDMVVMFKDSKATTGYARTQSDANRLNSSSYKPSNLTFVVKSGGEITPPIVAPIVGEKYQEGNYEYTYSLDGWGVRVIDNTQTVYKQPLEEIKGEPVTSYTMLFNNYPNTTLTLEGTWTNRNITDMSYAFYVCEATTLDLSNFNTSNVTNMSYAFYGCEATTLDLSNFNTSNVTNMICMFAVCIAGTLDLSSFDTSNVINMNSMFFESKATTLNLSSFDTSNVTNMGSMFQYCKTTALDLSSFNTSKVIVMYNMFSYSEATTLDLSSFNTTNVTNMNDMFRECKATTGYARTQSDANSFNASSNKPYALTFVVKPPVENEVYTEGNYKYTYNERNKGWQVSILDNSQLSYKQPLETIKNVPVTSYVELFRDYPNATLILEGVWENTNVTDMGWMFIDCKATTINLVNFKTDNVVSMSTMFRECLATTINVSSFNTSNVRSMGMMFYAVNTKTLDLKSFNTSNVTDMNNMFGNSGILELDLSSFDTSNVEYMVDIFSSCKATIGIAKTQEDADRFNSSSNKPASLTFNTGLVAGDVYTEGNYKYVYGYNRNTSGGVDTNAPINGWSVSIIDKTKTSYVQPLEKIKGQPVVSYYSLFELYPNNTLNLVGTWTNKNVTDMRRVFCNCKATVLNIGDFKTAAATDMMQMFGNCSATTLDLSSFNTSNVTNMHHMFGGSKATTLDLSNFNTSKVTVMSGVFSNSQATTIDLSSFNTSRVTSMNSMFYMCRATTLNLSSFDTSNVTDMTSMFDSCKTTTLNLNSFDTSSVIRMSNMFQNCQATTGYARTQADANNFNATSNKPSALIFKTIVTPIEGATYSAGNYKYTYKAEGKGWEVSVIDKTKTSYVQPLEEINGIPVTSYNGLFYFYPNTVLTLEGTWTNRGVTDMTSIFANCKATTLDLSNFKTSNVKSMAGMFYKTAAKTLNIGGLDTSKVTRMDGMFSDCIVESLDVSSFNTSNVTQMHEMFRGCKVSTLDLSSFDTSRAINMYRMFGSCSTAVGYARTQTDANKLNASEEKPSTLNFIVKPTVINKIVELEAV